MNTRIARPATVTQAVRHLAPTRGLVRPAARPAPGVAPAQRHSPAASAAQGERYVYATARAISAVLVPGAWVRYSEEVLRDAVERRVYDKIPIFCMHDAHPMGWCGMVEGVAWDEALLGAEQVPGVTFDVSIDTYAGPHAHTIGCGVAAGSLTRWSIGQNVMMRQSHGMPLREFQAALGQEADDGEEPIVCWIAEQIVEGLEFSLVDEGAIESARTIETAKTIEAAKRKKYTVPRMPRVRF